METFLESIENNKTRKLIGIVGIPGSGKSTLAQSLCARINQHQESCIIIPMDGFHVTKAQLDSMPNPEAAHARRGAHFTIDGYSLLQLILKIKTDPNQIHSAPSFDHSKGDPIDADIHIHPYHSVILFEGLYLNLNLEPWSEISKLLDMIWMIDIPIQIAMERVANRHVYAGLCKTIESARKRAESNDKVNAQFVLENSLVLKSQNLISYTDLCRN